MNVGEWANPFPDTRRNDRLVVGSDRNRATPLGESTLQIDHGSGAALIGDHHGAAGRFRHGTAGRHHVFAGRTADQRFGGRAVGAETVDCRRDVDVCITALFDDTVTGFTVEGDFAEAGKETFAADLDVRQGHVAAARAAGRAGRVRGIRGIRRGLCGGGNGESSKCESSRTGENVLDIHNHSPSEWSANGPEQASRSGANLLKEEKNDLFRLH